MVPNERLTGFRRLGQQPEDGRSSLLQVTLAILPVFLLAPARLNNLKHGSLRLRGPSLLRSGATLLLPLLALLGTQSAQAAQTQAPRGISSDPYHELRHEPLGHSDGWGSNKLKLPASLTGSPVQYIAQNQSTVTLAASSVEVATATLTIASHTGNWYYKANAAPHNTCQGPVSGTTQDLTSLRGNTSYTYKAYSDSACTTELASASAFLTKPDAPPWVTVTRTASGELTIHDASVSGTGTISNWQYQQKSGGNFGSWTDIASSNSASLSHAVSGLTNGTSYQFRVRAVNATGKGDASYTTTAIAPAAATLTASSVKYATGTLTIGLHSGNWYYKYTVPSGGTCQGPVSGSSKNLTGLASNTRYTFKAYSDSACSTELTIDDSDADFSTRLGKLTGVQVEPRHQSLAISWTAVDGADGYTIYSKSGNQNWVTPIKSVTGATSSTLSSLTNGVEYSLRVNAFKNYQYGRWFSKVYGTWSDVVTGTPATQRPDKPSAPTLTDGTNSGELNVAWTAPGNGGAAITGYGVQYRQASADTWTDHTHSGTGTTATLTGLTSGTSYQVRVRATNSVGSGPWSDVSTSGTIAQSQPTTLTATPTTLSISNYGGSWYYKANAAPDNSCKGPVNAGSSATTTASLASLASNTSYTYKAYSDSGCTTELATAAALLTKPGKPTGFTVTRTGSGELTLKASVSGTGAISKWQFQQKSDGSFGTWNDVTSATTVSLTHAVSNLTNGTTYTFKVRAVNAGGTGAASDASTAIAPAAATLADSNVRSTTATLTIGIHSGNWYYKYTTPTGGTCSSSAVTGTSTNLTGLTPNTGYTFKAYSDSACSTELTSAAEDAEFTTNSAKVTGVQVEARHQSLVVSWPAQPGGADFYLAQYKSGNQDWALERHNSSTTNSVTLTDLTNGIEHSVRVQAFNSSGSGEFSDVVTGTPATQRPDKPSAPTLTDGTNDGELNVSWTAPGNGGAAITGYGVQYRKASADTWTDHTHSGTGTTATLTGLTSGTSYQVRVRATNSVGSGPWSDVSTSGTIAQSPAQSQPTTLTATPTTLTLGNHSGAWHYKYTSPSGGTCSAEIAANTTTAAVASLSGNTSYTFKAYSDSGCTTELATASAFLTKPGTPGTPTATAGAGSGKLTLSATVTGSGAITGWQLQQKASTDSDFGAWKDIASTSTSLSYTVTGLTNDISYQFKVRAVNATGTGAASNASSAATPIDEQLAASAVEAGTATLTIENYTGAWYYKANAAPHNTCSTAVSATSVDLTGLSGNTSYTYTAYSDSGCTTAKELADVTFLTKPAKPTTPTVAAGVGSGTLTLTASVSGSGTLSKWEYIKKAGTNAFETTWTTITSTATSLTHDVTGLTNNTSYQFKVRAVNAIGNSAESAASTPVAPADKTLTSSNVEVASATLTLGNHSGAWHYKYTSPSGGACSAEIAANTTTAAVASLSGNTSYTFKAYSDSGCTTELATGSAFLTKPGTPGTPAATAGAGSGKLTLSATVTGSGAITGWQLQQKASTDSDFGDWKDIASTSTSLSYTVTGLTNDISYQFKVRAVNATGNGVASETSTAVAPSAAAPAPVTPLDETLTASVIEATTATLTLGNHSGAWHYKYTSPSGGACSAKIAANTTTAAVASLSGNTSYTFKAYSDSSCSIELAVTSAFLTKPGQPTTPKATVGNSKDSLKLTASVAGDGAITGWQLQQKASTDSNFGAWQDVASVTTTSLTHTVTGLANGTSYQFKVRAVNATGTGATSEASIAVAPAQATLAVVKQASGTTATLTLNWEGSGAWSYDYREQVAAATATEADATAGVGASSVNTCTNVSAGRSIVTVGGLKSDASYVFTAYSGSDCSTNGQNDSQSVLASATSADPGSSNSRPEFLSGAVPDEPVVVKEGDVFKRTIQPAKDQDGDTLIYDAVLVNSSSGDLPLPDWLKFDGNASGGPTFTSDGPTLNGTPGEPATFKIKVSASDGKGVPASVTFRIIVEEKDLPTRVETPYNSRLPQVASQWLARLGRTVSSQVTQSITSHMGDDGSSGRITVNGQTVSLSAGEAAGKADDASNGLAGLNGADPFATAAPTTKEVVDEEPVKATATIHDLLTSSSFRSARGGGGGGWMVWGEAALTNFAGEDGDLSIDGEVITGVAAIDWQRDRWLAGLALSQSQGDGTFEAPRTDTDDAIKGTVKSSLTAVHPYVRYRPSADLEFWGVAGYGRGTMTLDADVKTADDEATANPDIWLTTIGIGGRSALLTTEQTGGPAVDLTADALFTRTGADADIPLRDAVEAATTRVRLGVESSWPWQNANGTSLMPTLSTALRYDAGDAETGLGLEVGAGVAYANPGLGLTLSADVRGLLSRQAADSGLGLREWGGSGSIRYDHGGDGLGLKASLSPSWGVSGSAKDQLWSGIAPPFPTAQGDASADASSGSANARMESEVGYGFAAFSGNAVITPYGSLSLSHGSRNWRLGGRLSFAPGLAISIEGTRNEQPNEAPDHGVRLDVNTAW